MCISIYLYTCVFVLYIGKKKVVAKSWRHARSLYSQLCNFQNKSEACLIFTENRALLSAPPYVFLFASFHIGLNTWAIRTCIEKHIIECFSLQEYAKIGKVQHKQRTKYKVSTTTVHCAGESCKTIDVLRYPQRSVFCPLFSAIVCTAFCWLSHRSLAPSRFVFDLWVIKLQMKHGSLWTRSEAFAVPYWAWQLLLVGLPFLLQRWKKKKKVINMLQLSPACAQKCRSSHPKNGEM